jgi:hypothetical protein
VEAQRDQHHRLDILDAPVRIRRRLFNSPVPPIGIDDAAARTVIHDVKSPTETAFKIGFGFAAGTWSFRGMVLIAGGALLVLGIINLLNAFSG